MKIQKTLKKIRRIKTSDFWRSLWSYLLLLIYFSLFLLCVFQVLQSKMFDTIYDANVANHQLISHNAESFKKELDEFAYRLANDNYLREILEMNEWNGRDEYWEVFNFNNVLEHTTIQNQHIEKVYIYIPDRDKIFVAGNIIDAENLYTMFPLSAHIRNPGYEDWKEFILDEHYYEIYRTDNDKMLYFHSVKSHNLNKAVILLEINESTLLESLGVTGGSSLILYNHLDEIVYKIGVPDEKTREEGFNVEFYEDFVGTAQENNKWIHFYDKPAPHLRMVWSVPKVDLYKDAIVLNRRLYMSSGIFILVLLIVSVFFSKKNLLSLEALFNILLKNNKQTSYNDSVYQSKWSYVNKEVHHLIESNHKNTYLLKKQQNKLLAMAIQRYLFNDNARIKVEDLFITHQIYFRRSSYVLVLVSLENIDGDEWNMSTGDEELVFFALENIFKELSGKNFDNICVQLDENLMLIFIGTNNIDRDWILNEVTSIMKKEQSIALEKLNFEFNSYISEPFSDIERLRLAYNQVDFLYRNDHSNSLCVYNSNKQISTDYSVVDYFEPLLLEAIEKGDLNRFKNILESLFDHTKKANTSFNEYVHIRLKSIFTGLGKKLPQNEFSRYISAMADIDVQGRSIDSYTSLAEYFCDEKVSDFVSENSLVSEIISYVMDNYSDARLNVSLLGYVFKKTPGYISSIFKAETGKMLSHFISETRINRAEVLLHSSEKMEKIVALCGFSSEDTFRRTFKNYKGVLPSEYRKRLQENKNS